MKIKISESTLTALNNLRGRWLFYKGKLMLIRDFQYVQETPEPEEDQLPENTKKFKRKRKKQDMTPKLYVVDMKVEGYNGTLKFIGTYDEDYCKRMVLSHDDPYYHEYNLNDMAGAWMDIVEQQEAFLEHEAKMKADQYMDTVKSLIKEDKPLQATKVYKDATGKSLKDSKDFVLGLRDEMEAEK